MSRTRQFCTFHVADDLFGIEVVKVQEVIRPQPMTVVPKTAAVIAGLINLRGAIVTAIDLRRRLDLPVADDALRSPNVVVRGEDGPVSLLVDEIGDVVIVPEETFDRPPSTLRGPARELIAGIYKLPDRLMLVLDVERAVNPANFAEAARSIAE